MPTEPNLEVAQEIIELPNLYIAYREGQDLAYIIANIARGYGAALSVEGQAPTKLNIPQEEVFFCPPDQNGAITIYAKQVPIVAEYTSSDKESHKLHNIGYFSFLAQYNPKDPRQIITIHKLSIAIPSKNSLVDHHERNLTFHTATINHLSLVPNLSYYDEKFEPTATIFDANLPKTATAALDMLSDIHIYEDKINFLLTIIGNDKSGEISYKLLKDKKLWRELVLNGEDALRIAYVIVGNLDEALNHGHSTNHKTIAKLKQALKCCSKNPYLINSIIEQAKNIGCLEKILYQDQLGIFFSALFTSKQIAKLKQETPPGEWIKLRASLESNLNEGEKCLGHKAQGNSELAELSKRNIVPILYKHFQNPDTTKAKWLDKQPWLARILRRLRNLPNRILALLGLSKKIKVGNICILDKLNEGKGKILLGHMPSIKRIRELIKANSEKKIILVSYQAPEETYTTYGRNLGNAISSSTPMPENVTRISHPLFDHSAIETTTGIAVSSETALSWVDESAQFFAAGNVLRLNCKGGIERSNVMAALLYSYITDTPILQSFKHINRQNPITRTFAKLNLDLQKLAINTYFLMLTKNPTRLRQFLQQPSEVIGNHLETFIRVNLPCANTANHNWTLVDKEIANVDQAASKAFMEVVAKINEYHLLLVPTQPNQEEGVKYINAYLKELCANQKLAGSSLAIDPKISIADKSPAEEAHSSSESQDGPENVLQEIPIITEKNVIPIVKVKTKSGFGARYYAYTYNPKPRLIEISQSSGLDRGEWPVTSPALLSTASCPYGVYKEIVSKISYTHLITTERNYTMSSKAQQYLDYYCANEIQKLLVKALYAISNHSATYGGDIETAKQELSKLITAENTPAQRSIKMAFDRLASGEVAQAQIELRTAITNAAGKDSAQSLINGGEQPLPARTPPLEVSTPSLLQSEYKSADTSNTHNAGNSTDDIIEKISGSKISATEHGSNPHSSAPEVTEEEKGEGESRPVGGNFICWPYTPR